MVNISTNTNKPTTSDIESLNTHTYDSWIYN
jgi:hypothetical protein